ncbi:MAG: ATP-binding protein [Pseudomonadales bacterium]|nr:ATP-binding protein [Pseudomonadales bacterium]
MTPPRHPTNKPVERRISSEQKLFLSVLVSAVPVVVLLIYVFTDEEMTLTFKLTISGFCLLWLLAVAASVRENFVYHLRTLSNLIEAIRTEDYSMRSSRVRDPGELAELYQQIDSLTNQLRSVKQQELESEKLLERIVNQINVAIVACDDEDNIRLVNRLASKLLDVKPDEIIGKPFNDTALSAVVGEQGSKLVDHDFPGSAGRWQINVQAYRYQAKPGKVIFITDLKQVLSEEEISAWQRLIRVIAHEVNNSLTPISSICQTLETHLEKYPELKDGDLKQGLEVIEERAKGLRDFISVYARIAKLPDPHKVSFSVEELLAKVQRFFADQPVTSKEVESDLTLFGDPVQLEQALINLVKNAVEANNDSPIPVELSCIRKSGYVEFSVVDNGSGISNPTNLFIPFYTTKEKGAGIGLALSRQIAAKHGGQVIVENRKDLAGAVARLQLPITV